MNIGKLGDTEQVSSVVEGKKREIGEPVHKVTVIN